MLRTFEAQFTWNIKNIEPQPKFTGSYKEKSLYVYSTYYLRYIYGMYMTHGICGTWYMEHWMYLVHYLVYIVRICYISYVYSTCMYGYGTYMVHDMVCILYVTGTYGAYVYPWLRFLDTWLHLTFYLLNLSLWLLWFLFTF